MGGRPILFVPQSAGTLDCFGKRLKPRICGPTKLVLPKPGGNPLLKRINEFRERRLYFKISTRVSCPSRELGLTKYPSEPAYPTIPVRAFRTIHFGQRFIAGDDEAREHIIQVFKNVCSAPVTGRHGLGYEFLRSPLAPQNRSQAG
jgi:hypothetical protein